MRSLFILILLFFSCCIDNKEKNYSESYFITLSKEIEKNPYNTDLLLERVNYNKKRNYLESALFDLKQCLLIDSLNAVYHFNIADIYFEMSKKPNANSKYPDFSRFHLQQALKIDNQDYKSFGLLGELFLAFGNYKEAISKFISSIKKSPGVFSTILYVFPFTTPGKGLSSSKALKYLPFNFKLSKTLNFSFFFFSI